jgi:hypothetical protein
MERLEYLIISFLAIVIVVLIFSNITVSLGDCSSNNVPVVTGTPTYQPAPSPTSNTLLRNTGVLSETSELLSNDVKKQLNSLHNQFYFNN